MKINVIEPLSIRKEKVEELKNYYTAMGHEFNYSDERSIDPEVLIKRAGDAEVVVIANCPFPGNVIKSLPNLKFLAVAFTGIDHVDMAQCKRQNIAVSNASGYSNINVAELTVGFMIDILRNITRLDPITRKGGTKDGLVGFDLAGKKVGIIGTGAIGTRVAKILSGFDVELLAHDMIEKEVIKQLGGKYLSLEELMKESDIVTLHCPLMDATKGLINIKNLSLMKKSAYLINCARGPIINTNDLAKVLKSGGIAGAALDVFDIEPPLNSDIPFLSMENVIVTPHIAFATAEAFIRRADIVKENIDAWMKGSPQNLMSK